MIDRVDLREAGAFAFESFIRHMPQWPDDIAVVSVRTVYADSDQPSHCVRLWFSSEVQCPTTIL